MPLRGLKPSLVLTSLSSVELVKISQGLCKNGHSAKYSYWITVRSVLISSASFPLSTFLSDSEGRRVETTSTSLHAFSVLSFSEWGVTVGHQGSQKSYPFPGFPP